MDARENVVRLTISSGGGRASIKAIKAEGSVNRARAEIFGGNVPEGIGVGAYQVVRVVRGDHRQNAWASRGLVGCSARPVSDLQLEEYPLGRTSGSA